MYWCDGSSSCFPLCSLDPPPRHHCPHLSCYQSCDMWSCDTQQYMTIIFMWDQTILRALHNVNAVIFAGGKFCEKCWQDISRWGDFHHSTPISFIKAYGFYFHVGVIFVKNTKARKTQKLPPCENCHVYSTHVLQDLFFWNKNEPCCIKHQGCGQGQKATDLDIIWMGSNNVALPAGNTKVISHNGKVCRYLRFL